MSYESVSQHRIAALQPWIGEDIDLHMRDANGVGEAALICTIARGSPLDCLASWRT